MPRRQTRKKMNQRGRGIAYSAVNYLKNILPSKDKDFLKLLIKPQTTIAELERALERVSNINVRLNGLGFLHWIVGDDSKNAKLKFLLENGANIDLKDTNGHTPLMYAVSTVATANLNTLIEGGADLEEKDTNGATAMWLAAYLGMVDNVMYLSQAGANGDVCNKEGQCAIDVFCEGDPDADFNDEDYLQNNFAEIQQYLCRAGARGERCDDIRAENARRARMIERMHRRFERMRLNPDASYSNDEDDLDKIPEMNIGAVSLPKTIVIDEKTGQSEPISNAISWDPIEDGDTMVDFHDEMKAKRFYKKSSFNDYVKGQRDKGMNVTNPYNPKRKINSVIRYTARIHNSKNNNKTRSGNKSNKN